MAQYDNQTLKELQRAEVEILKGFIEICNEFLMKQRKDNWGDKHGKHYRFIVDI